MEERIIETKENRIATITIHHPEKHNALTPSMIEQLDERFKAIQEDPDIRAVVLAGANDNFCAGVDVKGRSYNPVNSREFLKKFNGMLRTVEMIPQPTIAMIKGNAVSGGLELALACTLRIASENARMGLPEIKLGLVAAGGATYRLPRLVGFGKAMEMCLIGETMDGKAAQACNLVNMAVPDQQLSEKTETMAGKLAANPPIAQSLVKDALISAAAPHGGNDALMEILSASVNHFTEDKKEGIEAFFAKRDPCFKGE